MIQPKPPGGCFAILVIVTLFALGLATIAGDCQSIDRDRRLGLQLTTHEQDMLERCGKLGMLNP